MPAHGLALYLDSPAFEITAQDAENYATVVRYEDRDLLESGWLVGEENLAHRAAVVSAKLGHGQSRADRVPGAASRADARHLQAAVQRADGVAALSFRGGIRFGVALELVAVEVDFAQGAGGVARGLVVEVRRFGVAAFTAGGDGPGADGGAEFDDGDEAVAAGAVPLLGAGVGARAEGGERAPLRGRESRPECWGRRR